MAKEKTNIDVPPKDEQTKTITIIFVHFSTQFKVTFHKTFM